MASASSERAGSGATGRRSGRRSTGTAGLFPFLSHNTLRFSRCTGYPYSADVPHVEPTHGNRFRVVAPGGSLVVEGANARDAAAAAVASSLPPGFPPAVAGTARDLA
ncbi:DUF6193 family natural product biosynthesis protein [Micromonospora coxensis]|uniref:DUF6193 family natural product biosynthesis protein n=1 Tax=Micromonospora coxensis TaxID=356852 RepID=UPI0038CBF9DD